MTNLSAMRFILGLLAVVLLAGSAAADPADFSLERHRASLREDLRPALGSAGYSRIKGMLNDRFDADEELELSPSEERELRVLFGDLPRRLQQKSSGWLERWLSLSKDP